jgi:hypothetical protein
VNTTSTQHIATLTNTGDAALNIQSITASPDYSITRGCGTSLAVAARCQLGIVFTPTTTGSQTGQIAIASSVGAAQISLSGSGITTPKLSVSATSIDFGSVPVGNSTQQIALQITNAGPLSISGLSFVINGSFSFVNSCGAILAPLAGCAIQLTMTPTAIGMNTGYLNISSESAPAQQITLSGTGRNRQTEYRLLPTIRAQSLPASTAPVSLSPTVVGHNGTDATQQIAIPGNTAPVTLPASSFPNFQEAPTSTEITTAPIPANPTFQDAIAPSGLSSPDLPPTGSFIQLHSSIPVVCASCPNTLAVDGALGLRPPAVPARTKPVFSIWAESEPPKHKSTYRHVRGSACLLGERFQTVRVYIDHREIGLKTSEATPNLCSISLSKLCEHINWSSEMPLPLTSGRHTVEVTVRDAAGGDESATSTLIVNPNE